MRRGLTVTLGTWLLAGATLMAADFWEERPFTEWSDKDVEKMLTDSPWAQEVRIVVGNLSEAALPTGAQPAIPEDCGTGQFGNIRRHEIAIAWTSALPIKQALVRRAIGQGAAVPPESQQALDLVEPYYAVTLFGLPPALRILGSMRDALMTDTLLKLDEGEPIAPEDVRLFQDADTGMIRVLYLFPKTDAVTIELDDEEVEFITRLVDSEVKKKFKLENMVFQGQLEL